MTTKLENRSRIILALDVEFERAQAFAGLLGTELAYFKIGYQHIYQIDYGHAGALTNIARENQGRIFADGKLHDIPNTVANGVTGLLDSTGAEMLNVHCSGGIEMMEAAKMAANQNDEKTNRKTLVLGVTILTSLNYDSLAEIGLVPIITGSNQADIEEGKKNFMERLVVNLARSAQEAGLDGVVASPRETSLIRKACGPDFLIVTPGIRNSDSPPDDQKRTLTAREATLAGADYLVIGRPILNANDPIEATRKFNREVEEALVELAQQQTEGKATI